MNLNTVFPLPAWLSADEKKRYNKMKRPFLAHARDLGIKMDPFLLAHINDYLIGQLLLGRAEMKLQGDGEMPENLIEKLFKHREKLGKMLQELNAAFEKAVEKTAENSQASALADQSDQSDLSDSSDASDASDLSDLPKPPQAAPTPKAPYINPKSAASFFERYDAERERKQIQEFEARTKPAA